MCQCARDAHGGTAVNSCQYSECHCCPACLPLLLLLAKHKYLFISYAKTIGVGSRGDAGLLCGRWGSVGSLPPYWQPCTNLWLITTQNSTINSLNWITVWGEEALKGKLLVLWHKRPSGNSGSKGTVGTISVGGRKPHAEVLLVLCHAVYLSQLTSGVLLLQQHQFNSCERKVSSPDATAQQHTAIRFFQKRLFRLLPEHIHDFLCVNWSLSRHWVVFLKNILLNPTAMKLRAMGLL